MQSIALRRKATAGQMVALLAGIITLLFAFLVPMDIFGMYYMFTVHMIQHLLLSLATPLLFLLSVPTGRIGEILGRHQTLKRVMGFLTLPFLASLLFNGNLWIWHAPSLLQLMMSNTIVHVLTNFLYILTGLLFWWVLLNPTQDEKRALPLGGKLAYLFFSDMPMMLLGAGMTFSAPLYSFTMTNPAMTMHVTASDQQLGGLLMWILGSIFFIVVASTFFLRWMLQQEKDQQAQELAYDAQQMADDDAEDEIEDPQLQPNANEFA